MIKTYGSEVNGVVSSITQFITYFKLVEAGLSGASIYALYKPLADNDLIKINAVVSSSKYFYYLSGYIFLALTAGFVLIYPIFFKTLALSKIEVGLLVLVSGVAGSLEFFTLAKYRVLLSADQRVYIISLGSTVSTIINTLIIVALTNLNVNIVVLRTVALLAVFSRSFILWLYVRKNYKHVCFNEKADKNLIAKRWDAFYLQVLGGIHAGAPIVLATICTSFELVSVYSVYNIIMVGITSAINIVSNGVSAYFGHIIAKKEIKHLQKTYLEYQFIFYNFITFIYTVSIIMIMPFIRLYTRNITDINYYIPAIGWLIVINGLLYSLKTPQGSLVISAGMYRETRWQTTVQGIIAILLGAILASVWGLEGILLGFIISNIYRVIDLVIFVSKYITEMPPLKTIKRILISIFNFIFIWIAFRFVDINVTSYYGWAKYATFVSLIVVFIIILVGFITDKEDMANVIYRLRRMV